MPDGLAPVSLRGILRRARHALAAIAARVRSLARARAPAPAHSGAARTADPRLARTDPAIAEYVVARDPEWFSIDVDAPEQDVRTAAAGGPAPSRDAGTPRLTSTTSATSRPPGAGETETSAPPAHRKAPHTGQTGTPAQPMPASTGAHPLGDVASGDAPGHDVPGHLDPTGVSPSSTRSKASIRFLASATPRGVEPTGETSVGRRPDRTPTTPLPAFRRVDRVAPEARPTGERDSDPPAGDTDTRWSPNAEPPESSPNPPPPPENVQPPPAKQPIAPRFPRPGAPSFPRPGAPPSPDRRTRASSPAEANRTAFPRSAKIDGPWPTRRAVSTEPPRSPWPKLPESAWRPSEAADRQRGNIRAWAAARSDDPLILEQRST